jgi:hypothetical protein
MKKRVRFGIILGFLLVMLAAAGFFGASRFLRASTNPPGANCVSVPETEIDVVISHGKIGSMRNAFAPDICFRFMITNNDAQAYDFMIRVPTTGDRAHSTILAEVDNIAPGQSMRLDYKLNQSPLGSQGEIVFFPAGQEQALTIFPFYMQR